jgi:hypothetical protein
MHRVTSTFGALLRVAMMHQEPRLRATNATAEVVTLQHPLPHATEKPQRVMAPIVTATAAAQSLELDRALPARTEERQLMPLRS